MRVKIWSLASMLEREAEGERELERVMGYEKNMQGDESL